jgi:hypothetical protein
LGLLRYFYIVPVLHLLALPLAAQSVEIHSEFERIDPYGAVVAADRSDYPREILSPELPRNAHSVFHISVTTPPGTSYFLYVGSNPANVIETTVYKEDFERVGDQWIPDTLELTRMPAFGFMPDSAAHIPGQTTRCYLLDIWVPAKVDPQRVRVEVLLKIGVWYVAPMEVRIGNARVPPKSAVVTRPFAMREADGFPGIGEGIDSAATDSVARYLLGQPPGESGVMKNIRDVVRRDVEQDIAIARQFREVPQPLWFLAETGILESRMRGPGLMNWSGAEWYLRLRDWIYRNSSGRVY